MRNRKAPRKLKPKATNALDLNATPLSKLDAPKAVRKRASKKKVSPSVTDSQCPQGSNGPDATPECHGCLPKAVRKRGPRQKIVGNVMNEPSVLAVDPCFPFQECALKRGPGKIDEPRDCVVDGVEGGCKQLSPRRSLPKTPPRRECLPDLNVTPLLPKSHCNTVLMKTHFACKERSNVGKEGVPVFRELGELLNENPFYHVCTLGPYRSTSGGCYPTYAGAVGVKAFTSCSISDNGNGSVKDDVADQCSGFLDRPNHCHNFADDIANGDIADRFVCEFKGTKSTSITGSQGGVVTDNNHIYKAPSPSNGDVISNDVKVEGPPQVKPRDSRKQWGLSIKRGCQARFTVKILLHTPHTAEIVFTRSDTSTKRASWSMAD